MRAAIHVLLPVCSPDGLANRTPSVARMCRLRRRPGNRAVHEDGCQPSADTIRRTNVPSAPPTRQQSRSRRCMPAVNGDLTFRTDTKGLLGETVTDDTRFWVGPPNAPDTYQLVT